MESQATAVEMEEPRRTGGRVAALAAALAGVGVLAFLFFTDPAKSHFLPPCMFHEMTGLNCPGCGGTRAVHQLLHGHVLAALHMNAFGVLVAIPFAAWFFGSWFVSEMTGRKFVINVSVRAAVVLAVAAVLFGILRNIPAWPFTLMSP
jgi:hypothetical protein